MTWDPGSAWQGLVNSPLLGLTLTLGGYDVAVRIWRRTGRHPLANPVLLSIVLVGGALSALGIPYARYLDGANIVSLLLGPATVALALSLYRQLDHIRHAALGIVMAVVAGCSVAVASAAWLTRVAGGDEQLARSMAPKSATTPIALALAEQSGGIPALAAVFTILTGILGAVAGPAVLDRLRVRNQLARGLAVGVASHGIGTTRALHDDPTAGALAGLGMALAALVTPVVLPAILAALPGAG